MSSAVAYFIPPPGGKGTSPAGVRLTIEVTWQEALSIAANGRFPESVVDNVLLAMLSADVEHRLGEASS